MHKRSRRGIVGIEAAIILIAFVIVAAAVAFVALNMGMTASQKSKEAMSKGLAQASTALEVDGDVIGYANETGSYEITGVAIPLRVAPGWNSVDLKNTNVTLVIRLPGGESYTFVGILSSTPTTPISTIDLNSIFNTLASETGLNTNTTTTNATAKFYVLDKDGNPNMLSVGEKAWLIVDINSTIGVPPYGMVTVEILPPAGAPLTVTRYIPPTIYSTGTVDLG